VGDMSYTQPQSLKTEHILTLCLFIESRTCDNAPSSSYNVALRRPYRSWKGDEYLCITFAEARKLFTVYAWIVGSEST
jgi:hypothetical protein